MKTIKEKDLFRTHLQSVSEGQVIRQDGRVLHADEIIKRRWGWPKAAAKMAADDLDDLGFDVEIGAGISEQQQELIDHNPEILDLLLHGLKRPAKEAEKGGELISRVIFDFSDHVYNEGFIDLLIATAGAWAGLNRPESSARCKQEIGAMGEQRIIFNVEDLDL